MQAMQAAQTRAAETMAAAQTKAAAVTGAGASYVVAAVTTTGYNVSNQWTFGFCGCCNECCACCYCLVCPCCAVASFRKEYDNSSCCFNCCCISPCMYHSIIREGYGIEGSCIGDICLPIFCSWCTVMRAVNEVRRGLRAPVHTAITAGREFATPFCTCDCYSCFCPWCSAANSRTQFDGSNCCFNCCCGCPSTHRNIIRSGYGIDGNCCSDCFVGCYCCCCVASQLRKEVEVLGNVQNYRQSLVNQVIQVGAAGAVTMV